MATETLIGSGSKKSYKIYHFSAFTFISTSNTELVELKAKEFLRAFLSAFSKKASMRATII